jgi:hypothetical protein
MQNLDVKKRKDIKGRLFWQESSVRLEERLRKVGKCGESMIKVHCIHA